MYLCRGKVNCNYWCIWIRKVFFAFDTLYAEGHRRYIESLSAYARLFLGRIEKPDVDDIKGISPAIAIEQKVNSSNPEVQWVQQPKFMTFLNCYLLGLKNHFSS